MEPRYRTIRREAAHEALAHRHPYMTLYGWRIAWVTGVVLGLGTLAHWVGIL